MAVMQNSITFGGVSSATYGIYIGGEGVFNAPARDVEMISVPGRNGTLAIDNGRFENITVTYTAINFEADLATFAQNLAGLRNALCSQKGYQRLVDTFHPDEFRLATFIGGIEITPVEYNTAAKFEIEFDCKPQRFLTSGEIEVTMGTGGTIVNPTQFDAKPLLTVGGTGRITINGSTITVTGNSSQVIYIDCDIMEAYSVSGSTVTNRNELISVNPDFPILAPGSNSVTSTASSLSITPRWWRI